MKKSLLLLVLRRPLVLVAVALLMLVEVEAVEKQNRQMGFLPPGGYMGGSAMGFYHPSPQSMGMPMPMGMGMGMPGGGGQMPGMQLYQQQQQPGYPQMHMPMQQPFMQGGQQGMFNPIRYTQYPPFSHNGAPALPAQDQQEGGEEAAQDEEGVDDAAAEEAQEGAKEAVEEAAKIAEKKDKSTAAS